MCEGYTDVIGFFQAGVPRAVATCGTALAEEHFTLLRNFGRRIVLAYDADGAGQSATSRSTNGSAATRSTWWWPTSRRGAIRGISRRRDPGRWPGPWRRPGRSCSSGSTACWARGPHHGGGPGPGGRVRPDAPWPSIPTISSATSTSCSSRTVAGSMRARLRERLEHLRAHPPAEPNASDTGAIVEPPGPAGDPGELRDPDDGTAGDGTTRSATSRRRPRRPAPASRR